MKKALQYTILIAFFVFSSAISLQAQPHPNVQDTGGSGSAVSGDRIGAGAPIGDGVFILLTLALGYAGNRLYKLRTAAE